MATTAITVSPFIRDSATADVEIPGHRSPFRSRNIATRGLAAEAMLDKRIEEINAVEEALQHSMPRRDRNRLRTRLRALEANLASWFDYLGQDEGPHRESKAVVVP